MSNTFFENSSGFTKIDNEVFYLQSTLSASAFSLFIRIYRATQGYGIAVKALSNAYLQKTTNLSKNTVTKALKELEELGVLLIKRRARLPSYYQISVKGVSKACDSIKSELEKAPETLSIDFEDEEEVTLPDTSPEVEEEPTPEPMQRPDETFETFWNMYDKKVGKEPSKRLWERLRDSDKASIMKHLETYIEQKQDKTFRKDPANYLRDRVWEDEVIEYRQQTPTSQTTSNNSQQPPNFSAPVTEKRDVVKIGSEADKRINEFLKSFGKKGETYA